MKNKVCNVLIGLAFLAAGVILAGNVLSFWNVSLFFDGWWTLFILVPSFVSIIKSGPRVFNLICFIIGGMLLLSCQMPTIFSWGLLFKLIFPVILLVVGVAGSPDGRPRSRTAGLPRTTPLFSAATISPSPAPTSTAAT